MRIDFQTIYVDRRVASSDFVREILQKNRSIPHTVIQDGEMQTLLGSLSLSQGKHFLYLTEQKGGLVKPCPATSAPYLCCRYTIVNQGTQCPMDCTYCILQHYLDSPVLTLNVNVRDIFDEIDQLQSAHPKRFFRFGTGELADSLALDSLTGLSVQYGRFFSTRRNGIIEFKTKTDSIGNLLASPSQNSVVSWSVNPQSVVRKEEFKTAALRERLAAAQKCQEKGFLLGFHFDPIVFVSGWERLYSDCIRQIFSYVDGSRIAWISLGALRFPPQLKAIIRSRFPGNRIVCEEMIRGKDGKLRYPRPVRQEMFLKIYGWIREHAPDVFIYFCMEPPWVWDAVMGGHPESNAELDFWFGRSLHARFPELEMDEPLKEAYEELSP
jgi:spore photoproduct lyase